MLGDSTNTSTAEQIGPDDKDYVGSLARGLSVLQTLARTTGGMTLTQMAQSCGMTRASARRFLLTLTSLGFVDQTGRTFSVTPKVVALVGHHYGSGLVWQVARPLMQALSDEVNESCSAAILDETEIVYVARVAAGRIMSVNLDVGSRLPVTCTSMGRVLLAGLPESDMRRILRAAPSVRHTDNTITDRDALAAVVRDARARGYALVDQELEIGLRSLSVPIQASDGTVFAALNLSMQAGRVSGDDALRFLLPPLKKTAEAIRGLAASIT